MDCPFRVTPPPRSAAYISSAIGLYTTPTVTPPAFSNATETEERELVGVVRCAVQRVHDPASLTLARQLASLFGQYHVIWERLPKNLHNRLLGPLVRFGDEIHLPCV